MKIPEGPSDNPDDASDDIVVMTSVDHPGIAQFMHVIRKPKQPQTAESAGSELFSDIRSQREEIYRRIAADEIGGIDLSDPEEVAKLRLDERAEDETHDE